MSKAMSDKSETTKTGDKSDNKLLRNNVTFVTQKSIRKPQILLKP